jgi:SPP1 gp7 family putative phage head morphogenesis protein
LDLVQRAERSLEPLLAQLPGLLESASRERGRTDAGEGERARDLIDQARLVLANSIRPGEIQEIARLFATRVSTFQRIQLGRQVTAALGVDVLGTDRHVAPLVGGFVEENASLIRNLTSKMYDDVEQSVTRAVASGTLQRDLAIELSGKIGVTRDRAKLIARDQIGKLYGQVNAARQREMGVERFVWRTVNDQRVRPEHEDREGKTYRYDDPPDGELPGEPINCRCFAEPVFDAILGETEE